MKTYVNVYGREDDAQIDAVPGQHTICLEDLIVEVLEKEIQKRIEAENAKKAKAGGTSRKPIKK